MKTPKTRTAYEGTCPACFHVQRLTSLMKPSLVLHGYQRPGDGYAHGRCFGVGYPPFELSSEGTVVCRAALDLQRANWQTSLDQYQSGEVTELQVDDRTKPLRDGDPWRRVRRYAQKTVHPGDPEFAEKLRHLTAEADEWVRMLSQDIVDLGKRIDGWELRPVVEFDVAVREAEERAVKKAATQTKRDERDQVRARKAWASLWRYVGTAVNKTGLATASGASTACSTSTRTRCGG